MVVRNPYQRAVSSFFKALHEPLITGRDLALGADPSRVTFRQFVTRLHAVDLWTCDAHLRLQTANDCWSPDVGVDQVIRLERLQEQFGSTCARLGLPPVSRRLNARRRLHDEPVQDLADQSHAALVALLRSRGLPPSEDFYDADLKRKVAALYAPDLEALGYRDPVDG